MDTPSQPLGRILLVDDEPAILRTFRYCLEDEGYQVSTANSAAQADALLLRQVFDLCFLDLRLGNDDGMEVLTHMRVQAPWMRVGDDYRALGDRHRRGRDPGGRGRLPGQALQP